MQLYKALLTAMLAISLMTAAAGFSVPVLAYKSKTGDVNTVDPAVNNYQIGMAKMKALDINGAIDAFLQSIYFARNNYNPPAYYWLGVCYKFQHKDAKAIDALKKHIEQNPGPTPNGHVDLGEVYMRVDRDREAEVEFNNALADARGPNPRAHNALGTLLEKRGDYSSANWHFVTGMGDQPWVYTECWMNLAENYMKQKSWSDAMKEIATILMRGKSLLGVDHCRMYTDLGICQMAKGDHQGPLDNWQKACIADPNAPNPHLLLAKMFDEEKHITSAIHEYERYLALAPTGQSAPAVKARMSFLEQQIKPAEAAPEAAKPSPFMRKQLEDQVQAQQQAQDSYRQQMESLKNSGPQAPKDSGF